MMGRGIILQIFIGLLTFGALIFIGEIFGSHVAAIIAVVLLASLVVSPVKRVKPEDETDG